MDGDLDDLYVKWRGQMLKGLLVYLVLTYINKYDSTHGYELLQFLRENVPLASDIADGPIYAILNRLHKQEMLQIEITTYEGRRRKNFSITELGNQFLKLIHKDMTEIRTSDLYL